MQKDDQIQCLLSGRLGFWTWPVVRYSTEQNVSERDQVCKTLCSLEYQKMDKVKNSVILSVIRHRQNPLGQGLLL
jgi:hypothetical protein